MGRSWYRRWKKQTQLIYFVSHTFQGVETRYQKIEKAALAVLMASRKLRPYFQTHEIIIKTDLSLKQVLQKPDLAGRLVGWSVELSEFGIQYEPRGKITTQGLADFVTEMTLAQGEGQAATWVLSVDGSSNLKQQKLEQTYNNGFEIVTKHRPSVDRKSVV